MADKNQQHRLKQKYFDQVLPALQKEFKISNAFATPQIKKVVVNMGVTDPLEIRPRQQAIDNIVEQFKVITGQTPQVTKAKKAIAGFKLRAGDPVGVSVTLRGLFMWEFLDKLISITLPRVKDFRGVSKTSFDGQGNYSLGLEEQIVFPEISYDNIERIRGLQVNVVTSATTNQQAFKLLELLGMPFEKEETRG
jgi:large subunit ribosomal protein L5